MQDEGTGSHKTEVINKKQQLRLKKIPSTDGMSSRTKTKEG